MADPFGDPEDPTLRYGEIEEAYRQERWSEVLAVGEALLRELRERPHPAGPGLVPRLEILLGHTHLYGLADPRAAADHYGEALSSSEEETLRLTAEEGLRLCGAQESTTPAESADTPAMPWSGAAGSSGIAAGTGAAAMPWLGGEDESPAVPVERSAPPEDRMPTPAPEPEPEPVPAPGTTALGEDPPAASATASLIPDVVEEPELIEVHQHDPLLAEEIEARETSPTDSSLTDGQGPDAEDRDLWQGLLRVTISAGGGR